MCKLDGQLHLCTCDEKIDASKSHWRLYRQHVVQPETDKSLGMVMAHILDIYRHNIIKQLNQRNCFDFNYQPAHGDELRIKLIKGNETDKFKLIYSIETMQWQDSESAEYAFYNAKVTKQAHGYVGFREEKIEGEEYGDR